jgi:hypothetical protein
MLHSSVKFYGAEKLKVVVPAKAGTQVLPLDSRFRGNDEVE